MSKKQKLKEELICGIDDSGRGPIIGPMIMAGVMVPKFAEEQFKKIGVKDSKKLSDNRREQLAEIIKKNSEFYIIKILPPEIDARATMGLNLNKIEAIKAAQIINELQPNIAIIDCPSTNIERWKAELSQHIDENTKEKVKLVVEHKADVNHVVCSAASIIAKSAREEEIAKIKKQYRIDFGSGYPSDPVCVKFLKETNLKKYKDICRQTWNTWKNTKARKEQKKLEEF